MTLLKHVSTVRVSNVDKKSYDGETPVRLCNYTDVYYGDTLEAGHGNFMAATASTEQMRNFLLARGDIVLTKDSETVEDIGVSAFIAASAPDFVCGYHLAIVRPDPARVDPKFLFWTTRSTAFTTQLSVAATGVTRYGLRSDALASTTVQLPALTEQRRIADFLDDQVGRMDRLRELRSRQVRLLRDRFADLREALVETDVAPMPLKELTSRARPINYGVLMPGPEVDGGIPLVEAGDVMRGAIRVASLRRAAPEIELDFRRSRLRSGDCVMAIRGSIGAVQTIPSLDETVNVTRDAARIVPLPERVRSEFLRHALTTRRVQDWLRLRAGGAAVKGINIADLRRVPICCPPLDAQLHIEKMLVEAEVENLRAQQFSASSDALTVARKQALITAAVTGKFDVTTARSVA